MNQAQSSRAFAIYICKREYKMWQREYRITKEELNRFKSPICKSVSWSMFNFARNSYLKSMAQLRATMKVKV